MRVLFIGTGDIGLPSLDWLLASGRHQVVGVVTQPDKPVGRKQVLTPPQTKVRALAAGVPVLQPAKIRHAVDELAALRADVAVVVAYGQILSRAVLDAPRLGCLNIHASLLPRHRGASPIQAAIREGDAETGVTIMFMDEGLDTGDILLMDRLPVQCDDTGGTLHDKLAAMAPTSLARALDLLEQDAAPRQPQENALATYAGKLTREDGRIDWLQGADRIERTIRAYSPWPGTFCLLPADAHGKSHVLKIHSSKRLPDVEVCPAGGTVLAADPRSGLIIACGAGVLEIEEVQIEGGRRMDARTFLRGHEIAVGSRLG